MKRTLLTLLSGLLILQSALANRPNILFILADDLGWSDLGCFGSTFYDTPNLDGLAKEGLKFTQAYAACPVCSPTRSSILTGQYPARTQNTDFFGGPQPGKMKNSKLPVLPAPYIEYLDAKHTTLAEALKAKDYATFFAGKWHLGGKGSYPEDHGFDINMGGWHRGGPYGGKKYFSPYGNPKLKDGPDGEHLPDRLATETVKFITANKDKPFLAYLSFYSVHTPLMGRNDLVEKYKKRKQLLKKGKKSFGKEPPRRVRLVQEHAVYAAMVEAMDQAVGKVLKSLKDNGIADNTLVIFFSDNGGLSTSEGSPTSNLPLRAGKGWLYEGGVREPMIVRWPGVTPADKECTQPIISTDFFPTILEAAGLPALPEQHVDGQSFVSFLKNPAQPAEKRTLFWHYPHWGNQGGTPGTVVRVGDWKLIHFYNPNKPDELYNISNDLGEQKNLIKREPERASQLKKQMDQLILKTKAKLPTVNVKQTTQKSR